MSTGLVFHERYLWHHTGNHADYVPYGGLVEPLQHAESPDTKRRIKNLLEVSGLLDELTRIKPDLRQKTKFYDFILKNTLSISNHLIKPFQ